MGARRHMLLAADALELGDYSGRKAGLRRSPCKPASVPTPEDSAPRAAPCRRPAHSEACGLLHSDAVDVRATSAGKRWLRDMRAMAVTRAQIKSKRARRRPRHQQERAAVTEERGQSHLEGNVRVGQAGRGVAVRKMERAGAQPPAAAQSRA